MQTQHATEEISKKIDALQKDAAGSVDAVHRIAQAIEAIRPVFQHVNGAVAEQNQTTNEKMCIRDRRKLAPHLGHQRVGNLEIGVDVLHIVVLVQMINQFQQLLTGLVVHRHGVVRLPGQRRLARFAELGLQRLGDLAKTFLRRCV